MTKAQRLNNEKLLGAVSAAGMDPVVYEAAQGLSRNLCGDQFQSLRRKIVNGKMSQEDIDRVREIAKDESVILEALSKSTQLEVLDAARLITQNAVKLMGYQMEVVERVRQSPSAESDTVVLECSNRAQDLVVKTLKVLGELHHEGFITVQQNNTVGVNISGNPIINSPELDALIAYGVRGMGQGGPVSDKGPENGKHRQVQSKLCADQALEGGNGAGVNGPADRDSGAEE